MMGIATVCLVDLASQALAAPDPRFPRTGAEWTPESLINPEELGDYFEGDIELPLPDLETMLKNGIIGERYRWPRGRVPYTFDYTFSEANKAIVRNAMDDYKQLTGGCITFHERTNENDFILFKHSNSEWCHSMVGKQGGRQTINYPQWCLNSYGSVMHEMLHALGFYHEQSRTDRDNYVTIMWNNIKSGFERNFEKYPASKVTAFGEPYDYSSVMHYGAYAFTTNNKKTIVTKDPNAVIGKRKRLSTVDLRKLMKMYKC